MPKVSMSVPLPASAEQVWQLIGHFNALPDWHPAIEKSEVKGKGKGSVRTLKLVGGGTIEEKLEQLDDNGHAYSYTIVSSPLPVANYSATIRVHPNPDGEGCTVEWASDFEAAGVPQSDAMATMQNIYQSGLDNLRKMFGG